MTSDKIHEIAETYINGNIGDAKANVKKMSKADFVRLLAEISDMAGLRKIDYLVSVGEQLTDI